MGHASKVRPDMKVIRAVVCKIENYCSVLLQKIPFHHIGVEAKCLI